MTPRFESQALQVGNQQQTAAHLLMERFRFPQAIANLVIGGELSRDSGYFRVGPNVCYGQCSYGLPVKYVSSELHDTVKDVVINETSVHLPFDPVQVVNNLRLERYYPTGGGFKRLPGIWAFRKMYYLVRPTLGVSVRKQLQKVYFRGWDKLSFPKWPVDVTVEDIFDLLLMLSMQSRNIRKVPFIWFWPDGAGSCTMMTHDVETTAGKKFCPTMMDLNESFGIKSAFQIVPEERYIVSQSFLHSIRGRGFEVNVHDLNHDGRLMCDREEFLRRVQRINRYGKEFGALGFRAAVMYRNVDWYNALEFLYDMSIPNVAHLEPQQGGCCTVMPFFIGKILELPLTTTQDYSLYYILGESSIELWKNQISMIREKHGLISFITHPDYNIDLRRRRIYAELLQHLSHLRSQGKTWIALPNEVAAWWRQRSELNLVNVGGCWQIEGKGNERARLAYAVLKNDTLAYELASSIEGQLVSADRY